MKASGVVDPMKIRIAAILFSVAAAALPLLAADAPPARPTIGKPELMPLSEVKPGMKGTAWTVFQGTQPEPVPVEILGRLKNLWGPNQDVILAKMGGKAVRTNVAGGMSGSPVYINGKLIGAVSTRISVFSPDAICGITPIELMLEINDFDQSHPDDAKTPGKVRARNREIEVPNDVLAQAVAAGALSNLPSQAPMLTPIDSPLVFAGFQDSVLREFQPVFQQLGITAVQGGSAAGSTVRTTKPAAGWETSLNPGETVAGMLVSGDMSISGIGTVTYNDGKRVLAFGHPFFNLGPVKMPMSKGEVVLTLASAFQPNKMANATEVVGSLHQDRHSGIMGVLGEPSGMIPVTLKVRSLGEKETVLRQKQFRYDVFVHQKWTPTLMMLTLYNAIGQLNELADEATYRLKGTVELNGQPGISLSTMQATGEMPMPAHLMLASWWGDKFNKLFLNNVKMPDVKSASLTVDLLPERRVAVVENAWAAHSDVRPGEDLPVKVFLRPYRGESLQRDVTVKIPTGLAKGEHRILLSDADTLNRLQSTAGQMNRFIDLPQAVSLLNKERSNNRLYVSLVETNPTAYYDDKIMPNVPSSVLNVMQAGRTSSRAVLTAAETASGQT